jgi:transcriptional regulator with PAS, ATPase and Fis domain
LSSKLKFRLALVLCCVMMMSIFAGCGGSESAPDDSGSQGEVIKLGFLGALTGSVANYGIPGKKGMEMAIEEINASGGILGHQVEGVYDDNKGETTDITAIAKKYITRDKVVAMVGDPCTGLTQVAGRIAQDNEVVILSAGATGTGVVEIGDYAIHNLSSRRQGPFVKVNCAAVPETLLESELFGYAEGAFTGARKEGKPGKFELANNGTIFLDEVADMSMAMQAKLLRVLQERELERVGGINSTRINVRVIAATNKNLYTLVKEHKFREDLYYRLNVVILNLPPLRERKEDIPVLCQVLLRRLNEQLGTKVNLIRPEVLSCFQNYHWPGNVRELENTLERAINFCEHDTITREHIPQTIWLSAREGWEATPPNSLEKHLQEREKEAIIRALEDASGNKSKAAKSLKIHRSALYRKMLKYNIDL